MVQDIPNVTTFWETEKKPGLQKTEKVTREYQFLLSNTLAHGGIKFDADLFTVIGVVVCSLLLFRTYLYVPSHIRFVLCFC